MPHSFFILNIQLSHLKMSDIHVFTVIGFTEEQTKDPAFAHLFVADVRNPILPATFIKFKCGHFGWNPQICDDENHSIATSPELLKNGLRCVFECSCCKKFITQPISILCIHEFHGWNNWISMEARTD